MYNLNNQNNSVINTYEYFNSANAARKYFEREDAINWLASKGISKEESKYYWREGVRKYDTTEGHDLIGHKNTLQEMQSIYGIGALEPIARKTLFGIAYCNAAREAGSGRYDCIPTAREIFKQLKKLLDRMEMRGFRIDEDLDDLRK